MPVDYSKWDALELSDDSDVEVHPNVDKKSFIRAKQAQIHQTRAQRRHEISTLKYERIINDGLLERIDNLLTALKSHKANSQQNADELVFQALIESAGDPVKDKPPAAPPGVHQNVKEQVSYSKMMAALVDQVKKDVDDSKSDQRLQAFIDGVYGHRQKIEGLQKQLVVKLAELEQEDKKHITSDDIHTGFDYSHVAKKSAEETTSNVELLNPGASSNRPLMERADSGQSSGFDGDVDDDDADVKASPQAKQFGKISASDYRTSLSFLTANPSILTERESDALLVDAFDAALEGKPSQCKQLIHQALLLSYCRQLGTSSANMREGVALFFKRITTPGHQAQTLFNDDVSTTFSKIRDRAAALKSEREAEGSGDREQIQLHAVDPSTTISIVVPPLIPSDSPASVPPEMIEARQIFESFPPGLQKALESGSLDEVNKVLGKMAVSEAEEVIEKMGTGGMLSLEHGVIDATNAEGQKLVEEIERTHRMPGDLPAQVEEQQILLEDTVD